MGCRIHQRHHRVAVHHSFERSRGVDLGDNNVGAKAGGAAGEPAPAPSIPADDDGLARQQNVGGADQSVDGALPGAVAVVEEMLGERLVHRDDRETQRSVAGHGTQAHDARRGFLGAGQHLGDQLLATLVQLGDEVGAVVHGELRLSVEDGLDVAVVARGVLALDGEGGDAVRPCQRRGHGILRGQRIACAQAHVRPPGLERDCQVGRLAGDVQTGAEKQALERALALEALPDEPEHRHLLGRPFDEPLTLRGEA